MWQWFEVGWEGWTARTSARDDDPSTHVEPPGLFQRPGKVEHRPASPVRHDVSPDESRHAAQVGPHRVLAALLTDDTVRG